jgi:hypothetical protein
MGDVELSLSLDGPLEELAAEPRERKLYTNPLVDAVRSACHEPSLLD